MTHQTTATTLVKAFDSRRDQLREEIAQNRRPQAAVEATARVLRNIMTEAGGSPEVDEDRRRHINAVAAVCQHALRAAVAVTDADVLTPMTRDRDRHPRRRRPGRMRVWTTWGVLIAALAGYGVAVWLLEGLLTPALVLYVFPVLAVLWATGRLTGMRHAALRPKPQAEPTYEVRTLVEVEPWLDQVHDMLATAERTLSLLDAEEDETDLPVPLRLLESLQALFAARLTGPAHLVDIRIRELSIPLRLLGLEVVDFGGGNDRYFEFVRSQDPGVTAPMMTAPAIVAGEQVVARGRVVIPSPPRE